MDELKRVISVSASRKLSLQQYGGAPYESQDLWSSESEEIPASLDEKEVEIVRSRLRGRVEREIERQVEKVKRKLREEAKTRENVACGSPF